MGRGIVSLLVLVVALGCSNAEWKAPDDVVEILSTPTGIVDLKISTYNLKFFGTGGGFNKRVEHRDAYLKQFILHELGDSDAVVFTEVVDVDRLRAMVAGRWDCDGYDRSNDPRQKWHQHVTLCYDPHKYRVEKYDADWVIPEVTGGSRFMRPALQAKLCKLKGDCFLQVLGVHLKAGRRSDRRIKQVDAIRDDLEKQVTPLPTAILGDFNSYRKDRSKKAKHDMTYFEESLSQAGRQFRSLTWGIPTYNTGKNGRDYDHVVVSEEIELTDLKSYPACGATFDPAANTLPYSKMRRLFSDHCYVTTQLKIKYQ